jgi:hypothetical protein
VLNLGQVGVEEQIGDDGMRRVLLRRHRTRQVVSAQARETRLLSELLRPGRFRCCRYGKFPMVFGIVPIRLCVGSAMTVIWYSA